MTIFRRSSSVRFPRPKSCPKAGFRRKIQFARVLRTARNSSISAAFPDHPGSRVKPFLDLYRESSRRGQVRAAYVGTRRQVRARRAGKRGERNEEEHEEVGLVDGEVAKSCLHIASTCADEGLSRLRGEFNPTRIRSAAANCGSYSWRGCGRRTRCRERERESRSTLHKDCSAEGCCA